MDAQPLKQVCGVCHDEWLTEAEYLAHTCTTGFTPAQPEHLGPEFADIQRAALERGLEALKAQGADDTQVAVQQEAIQQLGGDTAPASDAPTVELQ